MLNIYSKISLFLLLLIHSTVLAIGVREQTAASKSSAWTLDGTLWKATAEGLPRGLSAAGVLQKLPEAGLGVWFVGMKQKDLSLSDHVTVTIERPGVALVNLRGKTALDVNQIQWHGVSKVFGYDPELARFRVFRPNGNLYPRELSLSSILPNQPLYVVTNEAGARIEPENSSATFAIVGGATYLQTDPNLVVSPSDTRKSGHSFNWSKEERFLNPGKLDAVEFSVEIHPGYFDKATLQVVSRVGSLESMVIAGSSVEGQRTLIISVPVKSYEQKLSFIMAASTGEILRQDTVTMAAGTSEPIDAIRQQLTRIDELRKEQTQSSIRFSSSLLATPGFKQASSDFSAADLANLLVTVSGNDIQTLSFNFSGSTTKARLDIPYGPNRLIDVQYLDRRGALIQRGSRVLNVTEALPELTLEPAPLPFPALQALPGSGYFANSMQVSLVSSGAEIRYTLDGSDPHTSPSVLTSISQTSIELTSSTTISVFTRFNGVNSGVRYFSYVKDQPPDLQVEALPGSQFDGSNFAGTLTLQFSGSGAAKESIEFTNGVKEFLPFQIELSDSTTLEFYVLSAKGVASPLQTLQLNQVIPPQIEVEFQGISSGQYFAQTGSILISADQPDTVLYYTLDDSEPDLNSTSSVLPFEIPWTETGTLRAFARSADGFVFQPFAAGYVRVDLPADSELPLLISGTQDQPVSFSLPVSNDFIIDLVESPQSGTLDIQGDTVVYTPVSGFFGSDTFVLELVHSPSGIFLSKEFQIDLAPLNTAPVVVGDLLFVNEDESLEFTVSVTDIEGDAIEVVAAESDFGSVQFQGLDLLFQPLPGFSGVATIALTVCESATQSQFCAEGTQEVTVVSVPDAPVLILPPTLDLLEDESATLALSVSDEDSQAFTYNLQADTQLQATLNGNQISINPLPNVSGVFNLSLQVCDSDDIQVALCDTETTTVTVASVDDPPILTALTPVDLNVAPQVTVVLPVVEVDGDSLEVTVSTAHGVVVTVSGLDLNISAVPQVYGTTSVEISVCDLSAASLCAQQSLTIALPQDNAPVLMFSNLIQLPEDSSQTFPIVVHEFDGDDLEFSVSSTATVVVTLVAGDLIVTPEPDFFGTAAFTLQVCDSAPASGLCSEITGQIQVTAVDDAPALQPLVASFMEDAGIGLNPSWVEVDGDPVEISVLETGVLQISVTGHDIFVSGPANYSGVTTALLQICDQTTAALCSSTIATFHIQAVDDPPKISIAQTITVTEDEVATLNLLIDEVDGDALEWLSSSGPGVSVTVSAGVFTVVPDPDFAGSVTYSLQACDSAPAQGLCTVVNGFIEIVPVDDAPILMIAGLVTLVEETPLLVPFTLSEVDADVTTFQVSASTGVTVSLLSSGINISPMPNFNGIANVTLQACDSAPAAGLCTSVTVLANVTGVNDAPIFPLLGNDSYQQVVQASMSAGQVQKLVIQRNQQGSQLVGFFDQGTNNLQVVFQHPSSRGILGTPDVAAVNVPSFDLAIAANGSPWIAYQDADLSHQIFVKSWSGSSWQLEGLNQPAPGGGQSVSLTISASGEVCIAYQSVSASLALSVSCWHGSSWVLDPLVGLPFGPGQVFEPLARFGPDGSLYVSYLDPGRSTRLTMIRRTVNGWVLEGNQSITTTMTSNHDLEFDSLGRPWVSFQNIPSNGVYVYGLLDGQWTSAGNTPIHTEAADLIDLEISLADEVFIAANHVDSARIEVRRFLGSDWVIHSTRDMAQPSDMGLSLDANFNPVLTFPDPSTFRARLEEFHPGYFKLYAMENQSVAGIVPATDVDNSTLTYSILPSPDSGQFQVEPGSGLVEFIASPDFESPQDANSDGAYEITLHVQDSFGASDTTSVLIRVMNQNEAPILQPVSDLNLLEDFASQTLTVSVTDPDGEPVYLQHQFAVGGLVQLTPQTSSLAFTLSAVPNANGTEVITITASARGQSVQTSFNIEVQAQPDPILFHGFNTGDYQPLGQTPAVTGTLGPISLFLNANGLPVLTQFTDGEGIIGGSWNHTNWVTFAAVTPYTVDAYSLQSAKVGTGFVSVYRRGDDYTLEAVQYDGGTFISLPPIPNSTGLSHGFSLVTTQGQVYLAYPREDLFHKATVVHLNGGQWDVVGDEGFTIGEVEKMDMDVSPSGKLYLAVADKGMNGTVSVYTLNSSTWTLVGAPAFSHPSASSLEIAVGADEKPVIVYRSSWTDGALAAMKLTTSTTSGWEFLGPDWGFAEFSSAWDLAVDPSGTPYVVYVAGGEVVDLVRTVRFRNGDWQSVAGPSLNGDYIVSLKLVIDDQGHPVVAMQYESPYETHVLRMDSSVIELQVSENQSLIATSLPVFNPDADTLTFTISGGVDQSFFEISQAGQLTVSVPFDFEYAEDLDYDSIYEVTVSVTGTGNQSSAAKLRVVVLDVNEHPELSVYSEEVMGENTGPLRSFFFAQDPEWDSLDFTFDPAFSSKGSVEIGYDETDFYADFTPNVGETGQQVYQLIACDSTGLCTSATMIFVLTNPSVPYLNVSTEEVTINFEQTFNWAFTISSTEISPILTLASSPVKGFVTWDNVTNWFTYYANSNEVGTDQFSMVVDGFPESERIFTVHILPPPINLTWEPPLSLVSVNQSTELTVTATYSGPGTLQTTWKLVMFPPDNQGPDPIGVLTPAGADSLIATLIPNEIGKYGVEFSAWGSVTPTQVLTRYFYTRESWAYFDYADPDFGYELQMAGGNTLYLSYLASPTLTNSALKQFDSPAVYTSNQDYGPGHKALVTRGTELWMAVENQGMLAVYRNRGNVNLRESVGSDPAIQHTTSLSHELFFDFYNRPVLCYQNRITNSPTGIAGIECSRFDGYHWQKLTSLLQEPLQNIHVREAEGLGGFTVVGIRLPDLSPAAFRYDYNQKSWTSLAYPVTPGASKLQFGLHNGFEMVMSTGQSFGVSLQLRHVSNSLWLPVTSAQLDTVPATSIALLSDDQGLAYAAWVRTSIPPTLQIRRFNYFTLGWEDFSDLNGMEMPENAEVALARLIGQPAMAITSDTTGTVDIYTLESVASYVFSVNPPAYGDVMDTESDWLLGTSQLIDEQSLDFGSIFEVRDDSGYFQWTLADVEEVEGTVVVNPSAFLELGKDYRFTITDSVVNRQNVPVSPYIHNVQTKPSVQPMSNTTYLSNTDSTHRAMHVFNGMVMAGVIRDTPMETPSHLKFSVLTSAVLPKPDPTEDFTSMGSASGIMPGTVSHISFSNWNGMVFAQAIDSTSQWYQNYFWNGNNWQADTFNLANDTVTNAITRSTPVTMTGNSGRMMSVVKTTGGTMVAFERLSSHYGQVSGVLPANPGAFDLSFTNSGIPRVAVFAGAEIQVYEKLGTAAWTPMPAATALSPEGAERLRLVHVNNTLFVAFTYNNSQDFAIHRGDWNGTQLNWSSVASPQTHSEYDFDIVASDGLLFLALTDKMMGTTKVFRRTLDQNWLPDQTLEGFDSPALTAHNGYVYLMVRDFAGDGSEGVRIFKSRTNTGAFFYPQ